MKFENLKISKSNRFKVLLFLGLIFVLLLFLNVVFIKVEKEPPSQIVNLDVRLSKKFGMVSQSSRHHSRLFNTILANNNFDLKNLPSGIRYLLDLDEKVYRRVSKDENLYVVSMPIERRFFTVKTPIVKMLKSSNVVVKNVAPDEFCTPTLYEVDGINEENVSVELFEMYMPVFFRRMILLKEVRFLGAYMGGEEIKVFLDLLPFFKRVGIYYEKEGQDLKVFLFSKDKVLKFKDFFDFNKRKSVVIKDGKELCKIEFVSEKDLLKSGLGVRSRVLSLDDFNKAFNVIKLFYVPSNGAVFLKTEDQSIINALFKRMGDGDNKNFDLREVALASQKREAQYSSLVANNNIYFSVKNGKVDFSSQANYDVGFSVFNLSFSSNLNEGGFEVGNLIEGSVKFRPSGKLKFSYYTQNRKMIVSFNNYPSDFDEYGYYTIDLSEYGDARRVSIFYNGKMLKEFKEGNIPASYKIKVYYQSSPLKVVIVDKYGAVKIIEKNIRPSVRIAPYKKGIFDIALNPGFSNSKFEFSYGVAPLTNLSLRFFKISDDWKGEVEYNTKLTKALFGFSEGEASGMLDTTIKFLGKRFKLMLNTDFEHVDGYMSGVLFRNDRYYLAVDLEKREDWRLTLRNNLALALVPGLMSLNVRGKFIYSSNFFSNFVYGVSLYALHRGKFDFDFSSTGSLVGFSYRKFVGKDVYSFNLVRDGSKFLPSFTTNFVFKGLRCRLDAKYKEKLDWSLNFYHRIGMLASKKSIKFNAGEGLGSSVVDFFFYVDRNLNGKYDKGDILLNNVEVLANDKVLGKVKSGRLITALSSGFYSIFIDLGENYKILEGPQNIYVVDKSRYEYVYRLIKVVDVEGEVKNESSTLEFVSDSYKEKAEIYEGGYFYVRLPAGKYTLKSDIGSKAQVLVDDDGVKILKGGEWIEFY